MSNLYTDDDVRAGAQTFPTAEWHHFATHVRAVLDAVAPAIAARALREAARSVQDHGTATTNASAVRDWLRCRAVEIERGAL